MRRRVTGVTLVAVALLAMTACGGDDDDASEATTAASAAPATEAPAATTGSTDAPTETGGTAAAGGDEVRDYGDMDATAVCEEVYPDLDGSDLSIGLITDVGKVTDAGFNNLAYQGIEAAEACFGSSISFIETTSEADYAKNMELILEDDPDIIVTVGFLLGEATLAAATANPDVTYIGIDQFQEEYPDNYVGVSFRDDQGGFLMGVLAGLLTESDVVGAVGGREDVPAVVRFVEAYGTGAAYTNPDVTFLKTYNESFSDISKGASDARQFIGEGADVVFGAGGNTGSGGVKAATDEGKWGLGVDVDEYFTTYSGGTAPGSEFLASSAIKRVDLGVLYNIVAFINGEFESGSFALDAANGGIGYAPPHDAAVPQDVQDQLAEILAGLASGEIDTGVDPVTGLPN